MAFRQKLKTIQEIKQGLADVEAGETRPLSEFEADMQQNYGT
jgi:predicted transcriptional regulator